MPPDAGRQVTRRAPRRQRQARGPSWLPRRLALQRRSWATAVMQSPLRTCIARMPRTALRQRAQPTTRKRPSTWARLPAWSRTLTRHGWARPREPVRRVGTSEGPQMCTWTCVLPPRRGHSSQRCRKGTARCGAARSLPASDVVRSARCAGATSTSRQGSSAPRAPPAHAKCRSFRSGRAASEPTGRQPDRCVGSGRRPRSQRPQVGLLPAPPGRP